MPQRIYKHEVEVWWEKKCDYFVRQEAELRQKDPLREAIFYTEPADDQYEVFWVEFPVKLSKWLRRLQEAPEYKERIKRTITWTTANLVALHRVDHQISRAVDFWVQNTKGILFSLLQKITSPSQRRKQCLRTGLEVD
jgi:hypothetical protein